MTRKELFYLSFLAIGLGLLVLADAGNLWTYLPYWLAAGPFLVGAVYVSRHSRSRVALGAFLAVALAVIVVPRVRWNLLRSFYIDCDRLEPGMTLVDAREVMRSYVEVGKSERVKSAAPPAFWKAQAAGIAETP